MKKQCGLTLIELVVTIAVLVIVSMIAAPNLKNMMKNNRLTGQINRLISDLAYARSEAIKRATTVTITPVNVANWNAGWTITENAGPTQLKAQSNSAGSIMTMGAPNVTYSSDGRLVGGAALVFRLCDERNANVGKLLTVNTTGQTSLTTQIACP